MLDGRTTDIVLALNVSGVPVIGTVTTVSLARIAVPAANPGGRFDTAKLEAVIATA
jgi:hypothetical protein